MGLRFRFNIQDSRYTKKIGIERYSAQPLESSSDSSYSDDVPSVSESETWGSQLIDSGIVGSGGTSVEAAAGGGDTV